jgi:hypothetical protein
MTEENACVESSPVLLESVSEAGMKLSCVCLARFFARQVFFLFVLSILDVLGASKSSTTITWLVIS